MGGVRHGWSADPLKELLASDLHCTPTSKAGAETLWKNSNDATIAVPGIKIFQETMRELPALRHVHHHGTIHSSVSGANPRGSTAPIPQFTARSWGFWLFCLLSSADGTRGKKDPKCFQELAQKKLQLLPALADFSTVIGKENLGNSFSP